MERSDYERLTQSTAKAVTRELYDCKLLDVEHNHYVRIEHSPTGFRFGWSCRGYGTPTLARRMHVSPIAPEGVGGHRGWMPEGPRITFDPLRPARYIARDLRLRFINPWLLLWPQAVRRNQSDMIEDDARETLKHELCTLTGGAPYEHFKHEHVMSAHMTRIGDDRVWSSETYLRCHVMAPNRVDIEVTNVSAKTAKLIAQLLKSEEP